MTDPPTDALFALIHTLRIEDTLYLELPADEIRNRLGDHRRFTTTHPDPDLAGTPDLITAVDAAIGDLAVAVYR